MTGISLPTLCCFYAAPSCLPLLPYCSLTAPLLLPYCSLTAPFKAAMLAFPIEKGNPLTQVRGIYKIYLSHLIQSRREAQLIDKLQLIAGTGMKELAEQLSQPSRRSVDY